MPNLNFQITGVDAEARGVTPLLKFKVQINALPDTQPVQALLLNAQIQLQCPQRAYSPAEKEKLLELFGTPEQWGQTLRNRLWTHANTTVGAFSGSAETWLSVPCTFDLNIAAAKYFYGLEHGDVGLLFLFSGSTFYLNTDGRLQVERIPWTKEAVYRLPVKKWQELMEYHFPNSSWLSLRRDVFDQLYEYKRRCGLPTWESVIESLLSNGSQALELPLESEPSAS